MIKLPVFALCALALLSGCFKKPAPPAPSFTFTPLDYPEARETEPAGIVGNKVFGTCLPKEGSLRAFIYDLTSASFTTIEEPPAPLIFPIPTGLSGDTLVGFSNSATVMHGFFYDIPTHKFTIFDHPNAGKDQSPQHDTPGTLITGISANTFCGYYRDDAGTPHGFLCDRQPRQLTPIDHPRASSPAGTCITALSGQTVIGYYTQSSATHGFLYDLSSKQFTSLDEPAASHNMQPAAISGNII